MAPRKAGKRSRQYVWVVINALPEEYGDVTVDAVYDSREGAQRYLDAEKCHDPHGAQYLTIAHWMVRH